MQPSSSIYTKVPVDNIAAIIGCSMLMMLPKMASCHVKDIKNNIQITADAVMDDTETCVVVAGL